MNVRKFKSIVVGVAVLALISFVGRSVEAVTDEGDLSLKSVVAKVVALETRVDELEQRVAKLEGASAVQPADKRGDLIEITSPQTGTMTGRDLIVEGIVRIDDMGDRIPVVGVHPLLASMTWIQPLPVKVDKTPEGYVWRCRAYIGTNTLGIGEKYEVFALLVKKRRLKEGDQLERIPTDIPISRTVVVTRR